MSTQELRAAIEARIALEYKTAYDDATPGGTPEGDTLPRKITDAQTRLDAALDAAEAREQEMREALEQIANTQPNNHSYKVTHDFQNCEECKQLSRDRYHLSNFCSEGYAQLRERDKQDAWAEEAQGFRMRCIAKETLTAVRNARAVMEGEEDV